LKQFRGLIDCFWKIQRYAILGGELNKKQLVNRDEIFKKSWITKVSGTGGTKLLLAF
jgi:hypothetical protein